LPPCRKETLESRQLPEAPPFATGPVGPRSARGQLGEGDDFDDRGRVSHRLGRRFRLQRKSLTVGQGAAVGELVAQAGQEQGPLSSDAVAYGVRGGLEKRDLVGIDCTHGAEDATVAGQSRGDDLLGLPDRLSQLAASRRVWRNAGSPMWR
jgi:hypothetical protein